MKNIRFLILLFTTTLFFIGCESDDSNPLIDEGVQKLSKLDFTTTGTFQNGSFVIVDNPENSSDKATGVVGDNVVVVTFADDSQGFTFVIMSPASKGTHQITEESIAYIQYNGNTNPLPEFFFSSLGGSITISELEYVNAPGSGGQAQVVTRAKGTFNANLIGANFGEGETHTQNVSGNFDLYSYSTFD